MTVARACRTLGMVTACVLTSGCAHSSRVTLPLEPEDVPSIQRAVASRRARTIATDGRQIDFRRPLVTLDSVAGPIDDAGPRRSLPWTEISTITYKSRTQGALDGLWIGAAVGALALALAPPDYPFFSRKAQAVVGLVAGGLEGLLVGALIGARVRIEVVR